MRLTRCLRFRGVTMFLDEHAGSGADGPDGGASPPPGLFLAYFWRHQPCRHARHAARRSGTPGATSPRAPWTKHVESLRRKLPSFAAHVDRDQRGLPLPPLRPGPSPLTPPPPFLLVQIMTAKLVRILRRWCILPMGQTRSVVEALRAAEVRRLPVGTGGADPCRAPRLARDELPLAAAQPGRLRAVEW